jgi:membrane-associated phospholipid phosphatase
MRRIRAFAVAATLTTVTAVSQADEKHPNDRLGYDLRFDLPFTAGLLVSGVVLQSMDLGPEACRWCERGADDESTVNGVDHWTRTNLRWQEPDVAQRMSDVTGYVLTPLTGVVGMALVSYADDRFDETFVSLVIATEAAALSGLLTQAVKVTAGRERPSYHALPKEERESRSAETGSYWSGHSSLAFSFATATGTVASLRGYRHASALWAVGLTFASATAYLRVAGDRHYLTDTLSGAASGAAIGVALPLLHHVRGGLDRRKDQPTKDELGRVRLTPMGMGIGVAGSFQ